MNTAELSGAALDWAVAKCEGYIDDCNTWLHEATVDEVAEGCFKPSTDWAQGGPIMEREGIDCVFHPGILDMPGGATTNEWTAMHVDYTNEYKSSRLLEAVMRRYVAMKLGDWVELPGERT
jgi:hypothetical protein